MLSRALSSSRDSSPYARCLPGGLFWHFVQSLANSIRQKENCMCLSVCAVALFRQHFFPKSTIIPHRRQSSCVSGTISCKHNHVDDEKSWVWFNFFFFFLNSAAHSACYTFLRQKISLKNISPISPYSLDSYLKDIFGFSMSLVHFLWAQFNWSCQIIMHTFRQKSVTLEKGEIWRKTTERSISVPLCCAAAVSPEKALCSSSLLNFLLLYVVILIS